MATWEREEIASRVAASVPIRAKMGKPLGGQAPYGYGYENKQLVIDETEGPIRALLYTLYRELGRKKKVASVLRQRGYRTRNGSSWSDTTVERLLRDPTAKGKKRTNYTKQTTSGGAWQLKPESEWVYQDVPALVDEVLFDEVVASLDAKKLSGKRQPTPLWRLYLLRLR
jgi:site-specific DNA recombinase